MQFGEIDRLAVEAEAPGEGCDAEAGQYDRPAGTEFAQGCGGKRQGGGLAHVRKVWRAPAAEKRFLMARSEEKY
jgi:hypothetical protein